MKASRSRTAVQPTGFFIAIEGIDGSGRAAQVNQLRQRLKDNGYQVVCFDFPRQDEPSSYFVKQYLNGVYGNAGQVSPYTASLFYALDRFQAAHDIRKALAEGKIVLANGFAGSSMARQGAKIRHPEERHGFFIWLDNLEFCMLNTPRPNLSLVLHVPVAADPLLAEDGASNIQAGEVPSYRVAEAYDDMCQLFPKDFVRIDCARSTGSLSSEWVGDLVWGKLEPLLPALPDARHDLPSSGAASPRQTPAQTAGDSLMPILDALRPPIRLDIPPITIPKVGGKPYIIPNSIEGETRTAYIRVMDTLFGLYETMYKRLLSYAQSQKPADPSKDNDQEARSLAQLVLPLATLVAVPAGSAQTPTSEATTAEESELSRMADTYLPHQHAAKMHAATLINAWPRNELDLIPHALYPYSDQPLDHITQETDHLSYAEKQSLLLACLKADNAPDTIPTQPCYTFDLVSDVASMLTIVKLTGTTQVCLQPRSPRLGYDTPPAIDAAYLTDEYERAFYVSLEAFSDLQRAGCEKEAPYAVLLGNFIRWQATFTVHQLRRLFANEPPTKGWCSPTLRQALYECIAEAHPLVASALEPASTPATAPASSAAENPVPAKEADSEQSRLAILM